MKISIIMPSFNQGDFVEEAIKSVIFQSYTNWELIFIDGGSKDNTLKIVSKYKSHFTHIISESDEGQSDAIDKGISLASGDLITWLNTDDILLPDALRNVVQTANKSPHTEWFLGGVVWFNNSYNFLRCRNGEKYNTLTPRFGVLTASGPSAFFTPSLYRRAGGINKDLHFQMDTELWWKFILLGARFARVTGYTWALRLHADAKVSGQLFKDKNDPSSKFIADKLLRETKHIDNLTLNFRFSKLASFRSIYILVIRLTSFQYFLDLIRSALWYNKNIKNIFKLNV